MSTKIFATGTGIGTGCIFSNGISSVVPIPAEVLDANGFKNIQSISASSEATYFVDSGKVYSYGKGQLGNGDAKEKKSIPEMIGYVKGASGPVAAFRDVYSNSHKDNNFVFCLDEAGMLVSFGNSMDYRTGLGSEIESNLPRYVGGFDSPVALVSLGLCHGVVYTEKKTVYLFGRPFGFDSDPIPTPISFKFEFPSTPDNSQPVDIIQIVSGEEFSLFLTDDGKVYGLGNGESQCLGDPSEKYLVPTHLSFIPEPVKRISCGSSHALALSVTGKLYAWGTNQNGALGLNQESYNYALNGRVEMVNLENVAFISSSLYQNFVVLENGDVYGWGYNVYGNLGNGNNRNSNLPERINELSGGALGEYKVREVSIGQNYTLFLCSSGDEQAKPFGWVEKGRLNPASTRSYPDIPSWIASDSVSADSVWVTGSVYATGNEIGDDQMNFRPMASLKELPASSVAVGNRSGYLVTTGGDVYCWGTGYAMGQGMKGEPCRDVTRIHDLPTGKSVKVFASTADVCFVTNERGNLYSFGRSKNFLTGQGSDEDDVVYPRMMEGFKSACGIDKVVISGTHVLALDKEGSVYAWGSGKALGNRNRSSMVKQPSKIQDQAYRAIDVACGDNFSLFLSDSGKIFAFGEGLKGQLGLGDNKFSSLPTLVKIKDRIVSISSSQTYSSAIVENSSEIYFWGNNPSGVLNFLEKPSADAKVIMISTPTLAPVFTNQVLHHTVLSEKNCFAITNKGSLYAWGEPHLGIGSGIKIYQPLIVESTQTVSVIDIKSSDWQCQAIVRPKSQTIYKELGHPELLTAGTLLSPPTSPGGTMVIVEEGDSSSEQKPTIDPDDIVKHEEYIKNQTGEVRFWSTVDEEADINTWCGKLPEIKEFLNRLEAYQPDPNIAASITHSQKIIPPGERVIKGWVMYSINQKDYESERIYIVTTEKIYRIKYDWKNLDIINHKSFPLSLIYQVKIGKFSDWKSTVSSGMRKSNYDKEYGIQIWFQNPSTWKPPAFVNPFGKLNYPYITFRPAVNLSAPTSFEDQQNICLEIGTAIQCAIHSKRNHGKPIELLHIFARESPAKWNNLPAFPVRKVDHVQRFGGNGLLSWSHNKFIAKTEKGFSDPNNNNNNAKK